ncbi:hypothetical protein MLD38_013814 [Melastoma candidum]|uniref:Uncharacterized protein n=1 Tax=Melastoma candidum TaxID=119954 RepID=A0ACB9RAU8_9MYRT|nr:hypothetical protein MLD38_013814 [Melastoma candidum]
MDRRIRGNSSLPRPLFSSLTPLSSRGRGQHLRLGSDDRAIKGGTRAGQGPLHAGEDNRWWLSMSFHLPTSSLLCA